MAAAVSFVRALAGLVIHGWEKITLAFGLLQAALLYLPHSPWHVQLWGTQPEQLSAAREAGSSLGS